MKMRETRLVVIVTAPDAWSGGSDDHVLKAVSQVLTEPVYGITGDMIAVEVELSASAEGTESDPIGGKDHE